MNHNDSDQESVIQLQQLVLHLQSELNKCNTSHSSSKSELNFEQAKLLDYNKELLYVSNKQQKKIELYKKQIKNLIRQRDESIYLVNNLKKMQESFIVENFQLNETLVCLREDILNEIRHALNKQNKKAVKFTGNLNNMKRFKPKHPKTEIKKIKFNPKADEIQNINSRQQELITILEDFVMQLTESKH